MELQPCRTLAIAGDDRLSLAGLRPYIRNLEQK